jgi:hypothetical protein
VHGEALHVEAVVLGGDGQERGEVLVVDEQVGQGLGAGGPDDGRAPPVVGGAHRLGPPVGVRLHGEPGDDEPVGLVAHLASRLYALASLCRGLIRLRTRLCEPMVHSQSPDRASPSRSASSSGGPGGSTRSA